MEPSSAVTSDHGTANAIWADITGGNVPPAHRPQIARLLKYHTNGLSASGYSLRKEQVWTAIQTLKSDPLATKESILSAANNQYSEAILECAVRLTFMTACQTEGTALGSYHTQEWKTNETLVAFLGRVYPQVYAGGTPDKAIDTRNLSAHILHKNAGIVVKATETLSDHLSLVQGEGFKTLLVFHHRAFLKHSFDVLQSDRKDLSHSTPEAISR
ncbi:hypothetical protein CCUS01_02938 [Colletotrichum cuscutae]|uniref:Uncharacterized protein n=1 Tax=Colletotrichum cuscutae TaxID=1209917 RepID=A0AAJ0DML9_9PEZI|nr:hypothetical protein CCUS01_02938 [Colletotrichum cuscutae]